MATLLWAIRAGWPHLEGSLFSGVGVKAWHRTKCRSTSSVLLLSCLGEGEGDARSYVCCCLGSETWSGRRIIVCFDGVLSPSAAEPVMREPVTPSRGNPSAFRESFCPGAAPSVARSQSQASAESQRAFYLLPCPAQTQHRLLRSLPLDWRHPRSVARDAMNGSRRDR